MEEIEIKILRLLSQTDEQTINGVANNLEISITEAEHHLNAMENAELLYTTSYMGADSAFRLAEKGKEFLMKYGLA